MAYINWNKLEDFTYLLFTEGDRPILKKQAERRDLFDTRRKQYMTYNTNIYELFNKSLLKFCSIQNYSKRAVLKGINDLNDNFGYHGKLVMFINPSEEPENAKIITYWTDKQSFWLIIDIHTEYTIITYHQENLYIYEKNAIYVFKTNIFKDIIKNCPIEKELSRYPNIIINKINEYFVSSVIDTIFQNIIQIVTTDLQKYNKLRLNTSTNIYVTHTVYDN